MKTTGVTNTPATPEATGLEVDKMSKQHVNTHFDAYMGEILRRIPEADRKSLKIVVQDSYETGSQNWADDMLERFIKAYGYDPLPYLPTLYGKVVGNEDMSSRFLWDLRRLIADGVSYDYVGGLRDICINMDSQLGWKIMGIGDFRESSCNMAVNLMRLVVNFGTLVIWG